MIGSLQKRSGALGRFEVVYIFFHLPVPRNTTLPSTARTLTICHSWYYVIFYSLGSPPHSHAEIQLHSFLWHTFGTTTTISVPCQYHTLIYELLLTKSAHHFKQLHILSKGLISPKITKHSGSHILILRCIVEIPWIIFQTIFKKWLCNRHHLIEISPFGESAGFFFNNTTMVFLFGEGDPW